MVFHYYARFCSKEGQGVTWISFHWHSRAEEKRQLRGLLNRQRALAGMVTSLVLKGTLPELISIMQILSPDLLLSDQQLSHLGQVSQGRQEGLMAIHFSHLNSCQILLLMPGEGISTVICWEEVENTVPHPSTVPLILKRQHICCKHK